jgi:hypothetical protein
LAQSRFFSCTAFAIFHPFTFYFYPHIIPHLETVEVRLADMVLAIVLVLFMVAKAGGAIFDFGGPAARGSYFGLTQRMADCGTVAAVPFVVAAAMRKYTPQQLRLCAITYIIAIIIAVFFGN